MRYFDRPTYMATLEGYIGTPVAKVLTGIRRSGKSALLALLRDKLVERGVDEGRIVSVNFDEFENCALREASALNEFIAARTPQEGRFYVFLDEIQDVAGWENIVNSLIAHGQADVYLTGSNSKLLSSELATHIAERYVAIEVAPLVFSEYVQFARNTGDESSTDALFGQFVRRGGFPGLFAADYAAQQVRQLVLDIYSSILIRDVITRRKIRSTELFERVALFALDNVGNAFSASRISAFLKSQGKTLTHQTAADYLAALTDAYVMKKILRYDLRGHEFLETQEKYFAGDHGIVNALLGYSATRLSGLLENIVQAEMRFRGYDVAIGKINNQEVDFVASKGDERVYLQVCVSAIDPTTRAREFAPLLAIRDSYPKYVLSLDDLAGGTVDGVKHERLQDFLL
ncbi:MAG: ATP-binding protein, partial [Propionibacteriaceae bacterium]|nr:ATP-binding protein [Propionibacteriaceae bacterium]